jgi:outer membrane lipoprotein-sorting protein
MMKRTLIVAIAIVIGSAPSVRADDKAEEVQKKIHEKVSKYKSLSFKSMTIIETASPELSSRSTTEQACEYLRKDAKTILTRFDNKSHSVTKVGDQQYKNESTMTSIFDGEFQYGLIDNQGSKMATKQRPYPGGLVDPFDPLPQFRAMEKTHRVKLLPDDKIAGKTAWVMEIGPKTPTSRPAGDAKGESGGERIVNSYDKDTGVLIKTVSYDAAGKVSSTTTMSDIKVNDKIDPERFKFKAPEGVPMFDRTKDKAAAPGK